MKISLRSANLIDLVTSQGRVHFLATHTTKPSWRSRNFEKQRNSRFSVSFLIITRSSLKCCLPPKEFKNFRVLSVSQNKSRATKRLPTLLHCAIQYRYKNLSLKQKLVEPKINSTNGLFSTFL